VGHREFGQGGVSTTSRVDVEHHEARYQPGDNSKVCRRPPSPPLADLLRTGRMLAEQLPRKVGMLARCMAGARPAGAPAGANGVQGNYGDTQSEQVEGGSECVAGCALGTRRLGLPLLRSRVVPAHEDTIERDHTLCPESVDPMSLEGEPESPPAVAKLGVGAYVTSCASRRPVRMFVAGAPRVPAFVNEMRGI